MTNTYKTVDWDTKYNDVKEKINVASWIPKLSGLVIGGANYALTSAPDITDLGESAGIAVGGYLIGKTIDAIGSRINEKRNSKGLEFEAIRNPGRD